MSETTTRIKLPYPPTTNNLYATVRTPKGQRRIPSREAKAFKAHAAMLLTAARIPKLSGPVALTIDVYRPRRAGDLDGRLKALIDSMSGIAFEDDEQVVEIHARRFEDRDNPRVEVTIKPVVASNPN